ncbi:hypothetical protein T01_4281 [Trichinella spiralis]|uniref:Uncharacterized protein n=1 Tax=Trichinella spiralis TaxID=6334 RepID=A0A0V1BBK6_TRISP|nr:hypothetical protein T01_4281 [Trichinella spiralis]
MTILVLTSEALLYNQKTLRTGLLTSNSLYQAGAIQIVPVTWFKKCFERFTYFLGYFWSKLFSNFMNIQLMKFKYMISLSDSWVQRKH